MDHCDSKTYWIIRIKETIQWFPFRSIVEHNAGIIETDISIIPLIIKVFAMFLMRLF